MLPLKHWKHIFTLRKKFPLEKKNTPKKHFILTFLHLQESIAQGASAKVWKAKVRGKPMAIKVFDRQHIGFSIEEFRRELAIIRYFSLSIFLIIYSILQHDCLVPCLGACTSSGKLMIASEIMTRGSLNNVLKDPKQVRKIFTTLGKYFFRRILYLDIFLT